MPNSESDRQLREAVLMLLRADGSLQAQMVSYSVSQVYSYG